MMLKRYGQLFIISAPSGAGKTTLSKMLLSKYNNLRYSVSFTTRKPRAGEKEGVDYFFVDQKVFTDMINSGDFIEHALVHGNYYGTSKKIIINMLNEGYDVLLDIDTQGAQILKQQFPFGVFIFILPPSINELRERIIHRNDSTEQIELRMKNAVKEIEKISEYDYNIVNKDPTEAFEKLQSIYLAEISKVRLIKKGEIDAIIKY